ncbi:hypothetical protein [Micromonospora fluostatini]|uniref:hypothetical protein n=1 Tax=Micromonospora sp. JCM 30529 TaxID=3421643 RepID=UPI003D1859E0
MRERPTDGPCPGAHPVPGGPPPLPDGQGVPIPPRPTSPPVTRWQYAYGVLCAVVVLVLLVVGVVW